MAEKAVSIFFPGEAGFILHFIFAYFLIHLRVFPHKKLQSKENKLAKPQKMLLLGKSYVTEYVGSSVELGPFPALFAQLDFHFLNLDGSGNTW